VDIGGGAKTAGMYRGGAADTLWVVNCSRECGVGCGNARQHANSEAFVRARPGSDPRLLRASTYGRAVIWYSSSIHQRLEKAMQQGSRETWDLTSGMLCYMLRYVKLYANIGQVI
jgi:hypothetical protein